MQSGNGAMAAVWPTYQHAHSALTLATAAGVAASGCISAAALAASIYAVITTLVDVARREVVCREISAAALAASGRIAGIATVAIVV